MITLCSFLSLLQTGAAAAVCVCLGTTLIVLKHFCRLLAHKQQNDEQNILDQVEKLHIVLILQGSVTLGKCACTHTHTHTVNHVINLHLHSLPLHFL